MSHHQAPRIFVVDDESTIAKTLAIILEQYGFLVNAFTNPLDALSAAESTVPQLLISDVAMPELSGIELAIHLQKLHPSCKILLFSGQAATADLLMASRRQGHDFELLTKPIHPSDLLKKIREHDIRTPAELMDSVAV